MNSLLDKSILGLARPVKAVGPTDSVSRAAGLFRAGGVSSLPVVENGRVIGVVSEDSALSLLAKTLRDHGNEDSPAARVRVAQALRDQTAFAHRDMTIGQVTDVFASCGEETLPIVDDLGGFYGVVTRADLLAYLAGSLRPTNVAGMATPLGVYLTNGSIRAGAGNLGLFLSGVTLAVSLFVSMMVVWALAWAVGGLTGLEVLGVMQHNFTKPVPQWLFAAQWIAPILSIVVVMFLIRLSPVAGYHAAEHMTVHALEMGEELTPEIVQSMPRIHARCGTNLLAAASVFLIIAESVPGDVAILFAMIVVILGWRAVGAYIQRVATTKPPSRQQLENGVRVGKELVARFQEQPGYQVHGFARIWNSGLLQSMSGLAFTFGIIQLIARMLHLSLPF